MTNLRSDNNAGLIPEALAAIVDASRGDAVAYGDDEATARAVAAFRARFGPDTAVFFVATGTAANTLAVAALTEPWQRVLGHRYSHYCEDESTAPERVACCRTVAVDPGVDPTRLRPEDLLPHLRGHRDVHSPAPGVLTISNPTEFGTVYSPVDTATLAELAHAHGYRVHVDGARFSQAVAQVVATHGLSEEAACRALTIDAGVDALSFGGTKAGLAFGEAILFFAGRSSAAARAAERLPYLRKSTGHLLSKHRFVSAPFERALAGGAYVRHATVAARRAERLAEGLRARGLEPAFPRESNVVFVDIWPELDVRLRAHGHTYYPFETPLGPRARLMCSFATSDEQVDEFLAGLPG